MGAKGTGWYRLENGLVQEMDLPLPEVYHTRVARGEIVRVDPDGSPWQDSAPATPTPEPTEADALAADLADVRADLDLVTKQRDALIVDLAAARGELTEALRQLDEATRPAPKPAKATTAKGGG